MAVLTELLDTPYLVQGVCIALVLIFASSFWDDISDEIPYGRLPLVGKTGWDLSNQKARSRFTSSARALIAEGFAKGVNVFQVMGSTRPLIVLHPKYIDEIKSHPHLSFEGATRKNFFEDRIPGFEPFHAAGAGKVLTDTVRIKLTQALGSLTIPLSRETAATVKDAFPPSTEWKTYNFSHKVPYMVARISTLIFMGEKVCRDEDWINVSVNYTIDAFMAARELRQWPSILRPLVHWFIPATQKLRKHLAVARSIVNREIEKRELIRANKLPDDSPRTHADALDWIEELSAAYNLPYDRSRGQVGLSMAAIHTTSNLLTNIMYDLTAHPEYIQPLRDEIRTVAAEDGVFKKTSLLKLKLMDSVMKESQRTHPVSMTSMNRLATAEIPLSDGTVIPKGATIVVSAQVNEDESIYPHAHTYDGYRFYKKRQELGNEHRFQLVTTTRESFGFGHGLHACPGRFFAANESKILLIHLLLKYEWKFKEDHGRPKNFEIGTESVTDPTVELLFRSREPEVDLAVLGE
ncbi:uncharacterized protein N7443_006975 [Penicillium atrosanguineum]|uniref:Cytochrome P450 n=1 Tax=Penicillium atrosanguineum TaxID=1132637 RepID=A0A9W9PZ61_9EURO|nr:uncharacterized protein N7443_006975 [Penicillium atrosanguineum]KAJ5142256.1 hypothetical protein N7526_003251 [Penicillium atrosanguineum]KAJ5298855.1 hypothetical protein N7443_006975 [Penicillium atrosanguineum]KAJ5320882.1 hypothetical protein N7476_003884 [Penicillium atrosanguineum]